MAVRSDAAATDWSVLSIMVVLPLGSVPVGTGTAGYMICASAM